MISAVKLLPIGLRQLLRSACTQAAHITQSTPPPTSPTATLLAEPLSKRALIRVQGKEIVPFLQGLITNDMNQLSEDGKQSIFTMFLNNGGRVLYDSIVYKTSDPETYILECDGEVSTELQRHLRIYRVKKKINIDCIKSEFTPWVVYNPQRDGEQPRLSGESLDLKPDGVLYTTDPRIAELGVRVIQPSYCQVNDIAKLFPHQSVDTSTEYNLLRCVNGVGEGIVDHPPGKCFPLEANCDFLNGISFHKGCYVGQELTARVHHTGVVRKRLMPLELTTNIAGDATQVQTQAGAVVGTIRSVVQRSALALLRVEQVLSAGSLLVGGDVCKVIKPSWWPQDVPSRPSLRTR